MDENTFKKQIEGQLRNKFKKCFEGGCFWNTENDITVGVLINNIENLVQQLVVIAVTHPELKKCRYDVTKGEKDNIEQIDKIIKEYIEPSIDMLVHTISNEKTKTVIFMSESLKLDIVMFTKLQNGKIIEREFGTKENNQQYTPEEVKVILKEAEEIECDEKFKDERFDKFTFLSMIVDMIDKSIGENSENPIRFITLNNDNKDKVYEEIQQTVNKAKQDPNSPNILLIPYSADGHIVTLLVDKNEFPESNSVICFDSSHYFTSNFKSTEKPTVSSYIRLGIKYVADHHIFTTALLTMGTIGAGVGLGITGGPAVGIASAIAIGTTGVVGAQFIDGVCSNILTSNFNNKCFSNELYDCMVKKPINDKVIQGLEGTCSFYTEAFCYLMSKYIQNNEDKDIDLNSIREYINSKEFMKQLEDKKEEFFNEYKATMEEIK